ncbi:MAG: xanthine dehydrogenase accessory protein XdhC [Leptothrix sp. (in: b-proteobacteria)]
MTHTELLATAQRWLASGREVIDVSVLAHRGSVPREAGTHMLVSADAVAGTVGGGHLELKAMAAARDLLGSGRLDASPVDLRFPLGPALGQCCGGDVTLRLQPLSVSGLASWAVPAPRFHLQLFGAGHVGRAIVALLAGIDCRVQWIDEREAEFPPLDAQQPEPPHIERLCVDAVEAEVASAPAGARFLVLTHSHDLDLRITEVILKRPDFGWCGLIGSQTKRARFLARLAQRGVSEAALARLVCPIGVPGITGKEPEVIAVAVVAQLLSLPSR